MGFGKCQSALYHQAMSNFSLSVWRLGRPHYVAFALALVLLLWFSGQWAWQRSVARAEQDAKPALTRFVAHLSAELGRYRVLPALFAHRDVLRNALVDGNNPARIDLANRHLETLNHISGASAVYLMDTRGLTIAASNWLSSDSFVGKNFSFRPYFQDALNGEQGRYYALGTTSLARGYYFSAPLRYAAEVVGVVVVKMELDGIEGEWSGKAHEFLVTDPDGVVFIATRPDWLYRSERPMSDGQKEALRRSRRYPGKRFNPIPLSREEPTEPVPVPTQVNFQGERFLQWATWDDEAHWRVTILTDTQAVEREVVRFLLLEILLLTLLASLLQLGWQRRRRQQELLRLEYQAKQKLERQVATRTQALTREVEERRRTEEVLRETRDELVQAAKLAVLGQLSASLSHELNNPLSAIRSYADNARHFLQREQFEQVDGNLGRIGELTERMAKLSAQLKMFARKSETRLERMAVQPAVLAAVDLVRPQAKRYRVTIKLSLPEEPLMVQANLIQLEQVLVNLLTNALQAVAEVEKPSVWIIATQKSERVCLVVKDNGVGIDKAQLSQLFEPFFTTRQSGLGLGLSISRQIMQSMKGDIHGCNRSQRGAKFLLTLPVLEDG